MDNENEILDAEIEEKETIDAEVIDEESTSELEYDPNVVLNTIMQSQDMGFRNVLMKLSTLNVASKAAIICLLFKVLNYVGIAALLYSIYCIIYVLLNYKKINGNERTVQDLFAKDGKSKTLKQIIWTNVIIVLLCIPLAVLSFWYYYVFQVS
jgi:hypothetical protein